MSFGLGYLSRVYICWGTCQSRQKEMNTFISACLCFLLFNSTQVGALELYHGGGAEACERVAQPPRFTVRVRAVGVLCVAVGVFCAVAPARRVAIYSVCCICLRWRLTYCAVCCSVDITAPFVLLESTPSARRGSKHSAELVLCSFVCAKPSRLSIRSNGFLFRSSFWLSLQV